MEQRKNRKVTISNLQAYNVKMLREFKRSLKHIIFDETLTLYILRPIAFIFVKLFYKTKITPNQVSLMSIIIGMISGYFFSRGTHTSFIIAGILYFTCLVFDCVDGMIARLKKSGTAVGRIIDGFADYIVGIFVYVGLGIGFDKMGGLGYFLPHWWILVISAVSHIFHSMIVDYYRVEFMAHGLGKVTSTWDENKKFALELENIKYKKGKLLEKILIAVYLGYSKLQLFKMNEKENYNRKAYYHSNKLMIKLWFWIGPTAHVFVLIIAAFLNRPVIFFIYTIGIANIYMIVLWIIQVKIKKRIVLRNEQSNLS